MNQPLSFWLEVTWNLDDKPRWMKVIKYSASGAKHEDHRPICGLEATNQRRVIDSTAERGIQSFLLTHRQINMFSRKIQCPSTTAAQNRCDKHRLCLSSVGAVTLRSTPPFIRVVNRIRRQPPKILSWLGWTERESTSSIVVLGLDGTMICAYWVAFKKAYEFWLH